VKGYRSHFEMCMDILNASVQPIRKTRLMYNTNINCTVLTEMVEDLVERGLMKKERLKRKMKQGAYRLSNNPTKSPFFNFQTTLKGLEFVELWRKLCSLWKKESEP